MPHGPVLPVKFGTVLDGEPDVVRLLGQAKRLITQELKRYEGKVQMEVSVLWDTAEVFLALSQMLSVVEMKNKAEGGDPEAKRQLGMHVKALMDEKRNSYSKEILPTLSAVTDKMVVQPVMSDEVVFSAALLIAPEEEPILDGVLNNLDEQYGGQFNIRCMGPMPLYSFATIKAEKVDPAMIARACKVLELPSPATLEGIKRAYRKKAQQSHPDRVSEDAHEVNEKMSELTAAYQLLTSFAKSQLINTLQVEGERCHFDQEAVQSTLLITCESQFEEMKQTVSR